MSINLSDLTSPNNQDVLAEITSAADFLDPIGKLENLSRSPNKGGHALQTTALNQPKALPLIGGDGYLYLSGVSGNYAEVNTPILPATGDFDLTIDFVFKGPVPNDRVELFHQYDGSSGRFLMSLTSDNKLRVFWGPVGTKEGGVIVDGQKHTARLERSGSSFTLSLDGTPISTWTSSAAIVQLNSSIGLGALSNDRFFKGAIFSVTEGSNVNIDFTATNSPRHGATKFKCATNQIVTINQDSSSSNDVATIIKKPVLRFDGVNDGLQGLLNQTVTDGYFFVAYSVVGNGGQNFGRIASLNSTGEADSSTNYAILAMRGGASSSAVTRSIINGIGQLDHNGMFSDDVKDVLFELKFAANNAFSKINNANTQSINGSSTVDAEEFNVGANAAGSNAGAIDLEYLALFSANSVPDEATASKIRSYINNRNNVFDLKDGFGYYFYDAQNAPVGNITDVNTWSGRIVGSDNGDSASIVAQQATANDQPVGNGYTVTFADNTDHLDIPSTSQAGWQVVGTSLGTFAYRVNANAVTELNILGNLGSIYTRQAGDLYGIILLPESATGRDIEEAKNLLIDRGASEIPSGIIRNFWRFRAEIVNFKAVDMSSVTFAREAWYGCSSLSQFEVTEIPACNDFQQAWQNCSSLTSFPAGAKLGTAANNVNFTSAWRSSGLTSFPALDLSTGTNFFAAWHDSQLTQFSENAKLGTNASNVNFGEAFITTDLTSFSTPLRNGSSFYKTWLACFSLTDFSYDVLKDWNPDSISNQVFHETWLFCPLTAQSVENILTSIDASNQHGTDDGTSTGNPLGDSGIDIDYNVATGSLSAATNAAVTSLKAKGWVIVVNGVTL